MTDLPSRPNLLKELDARQDEVLEQLEELNARVETLIAQFTAGGDEGGFSAVDGGAGERGY